MLCVRGHQPDAAAARASMCGPPLSPSLPSSKANALSCILDAPEVLIEISISRSHRYKLYYTSSTEGSLTAATVATLPLAQADHADRLVSTHWSSGPGRRIGYDHLERSTCKVEHPRCPLVRNPGNRRFDRVQWTLSRLRQGRYEGVLENNGRRRIVIPLRLASCGAH